MNDYIKTIIDKGKRLDGRKFNEFRKPIKIELNISNKAEGSARVLIGDTEVIAGVKLDVGEPYRDSEDEGVLITSAELLALSSPELQPGPPPAKTIEIARIIDRGIRESKMIDLKKLCIKKGELVWIVYLDIYTINDDGNLIDAAALAAVSALKSAVFPKLENEKVIYGEFTKKQLPINLTVLTTTVMKIGDTLIIDPNTEEEEVMDARLSIAISDDGNIHAMQKGGEQGLTIDEIDKAIGLAIISYKELYKVCNESHKV